MKSKAALFFRLNLIALRLNNHYKLNIYGFAVLFICIISSIIFRATGGLPLHYIDLPAAAPSFVPIIQLLIIFTTIFSIKLMIDIIIRCVQSFKIIPDFIKSYKAGLINIKSIISFYYLQNIIFLMLSLWILYIIYIRLNIFLGEDSQIYLLIIFFGVVGSINFYYAFPNLLIFNIAGEVEHNTNKYSNFVYLLFIFFILFYIFIFPLCVVNIINSESFINFCNKYDNYLIKNCFNYMNNPNNNFNTQVENSNNQIIVSSSSVVSNNFNTNIVNKNNSIKIMTLADGRQIIINNNSGLASTDSQTEIESSVSHRSTALINSQSIELSQNINTDSTTASHSQIATTSYFITSPNIMKTFKWGVNLFNLKQPNFNNHILLDPPMLKIAINKFEELLLESYRLRNYMDHNIAIIYKQNMFKCLNYVIADLKVFLNIQLKIEELNRLACLPLEAFNNPLLPLHNSLIENHLNVNKLLTSQLSNKNFNKELFKILINLIPDNNFTLKKLKEFYFLHDLEFLNGKTNRLIKIKFYDNILILHNKMLKNIAILQDSPLQTERKERLAFYHLSFYNKFHELMENYSSETKDNIKWKYDHGVVKVKNVPAGGRLTKFYKTIL